MGHPYAKIRGCMQISQEVTDSAASANAFTLCKLDGNEAFIYYHLNHLIQLQLKFGSGRGH